MRRSEVIRMVRQQAGEELLAWDQAYLQRHAKRYALTLERLGPGNGRRLLDLGAFPGHLTLAAHHLGWRVSAVNGPGESPRSLELLRNRLGRLGIELHAVDLETGPLPFAAGEFDAVLATEIIEHLPYNPFRLLRESFRVLAPGGRLVLSTPNLARRENLRRLLRGRPVQVDITGRLDVAFSTILSTRHVREYTAGELEYLLAGQNKEMYAFDPAGVEVVEIWPPAGPADRLAGAVLPGRGGDTLLASALRPAGVDLLEPADLETEGFYQVEEQPAAREGIARWTSVPYRWSGPQARISLPCSDAPWQAFTLHLARPVPFALPPALWTVFLGDEELGRFILAPDRQYQPLHLVLDREQAVDGVFPLTLRGPAWVPAKHEDPFGWEFSLDDDRELGLVLAWDGVLRRDFSNVEQMRAWLGRRRAQATALGGPPPQWVSPLPLLSGTSPPARLDLGPRPWSQAGLWLRHLLRLPQRPPALGPDEVFLGPGWSPREWAPRQGFMRWTGGWAEAWLTAPAGAQALAISGGGHSAGDGGLIKATVRVLSGDDALAQGELEFPPGVFAAHRLALSSSPPQGGPVRVIISVANPGRLEGEPARELGILVNRLSVE